MKLYRRIAWAIFLGAVLTVAWVAHAEGIQVYQNGTRVGATSQNVLNCTPPARCGISGNAVTVGADAGASGVTPTGLCGDGGTALGWDGGAYYCASTDTGAWRIGYLNCDLTIAGVQTLSTNNGVYTFCQDAGLPALAITRRRTAGDATTMALGSNGLRIIPTSSTDLWDATWTAPSITIPLTSIVPNMTPETPIRLTTYVTTNSNANYDHAALGVINLNNVTNYAFLKANIGHPGNAMSNSAAITNGNQLTQGFSYATVPNVIQLTFPNGVGAGTAYMSVGYWSSGLPAQTAMQPMDTLSASQLPHGATWETKPWGSLNADLSSYALIMAAGRAGSGTSLTVDFKFVRVEYRP